MRAGPLRLTTYSRRLIHGSRGVIATGALLGVVGLFLPWYTISSSVSHYYAEVTPEANLSNVRTASPVFVLLGLDGFLLAAGLAAPILRRRGLRVFLGIITLVIALILIGLIVLVDALSPIIELSYPYTAPTPDIGQFLAGAGYICVACASIFNLRRHPSSD